jgi:hypothetical protein
MACDSALARQHRRRLAASCERLPLSLRQQSPPLVENFVDNSAVPVRIASVRGTPRPVARKYGMEIFIIIKDLHRRDAGWRATTVGAANAGAAVELWHRAGCCFVDG